MSSSTSAGATSSLVEDLVDTGLTIAYLLDHLAARGPRTLDVCTLLDRPARRIVPLEVRYVGAQIPDVFVLGYGLHRADLYRNVPRVVEADRDACSSGTRAPTSTRCTRGCPRTPRRRQGATTLVLGWRGRSGGARDPHVARGSSSGGSLEPADRAPPRERRPAVPPDLHRPARSHRDRVRAAGHGNAAADDPRPVQDRPRRPRAPSWCRS